MAIFFLKEKMLYNFIINTNINLSVQCSLTDGKQIKQKRRRTMASPRVGLSLEFEVGSLSLVASSRKGWRSTCGQTCQLIDSLWHDR